MLAEKKVPLESMHFLALASLSIASAITLPSVTILHIRCGKPVHSVRRLHS